jgi:hypothetical protein
MCECAVDGKVYAEFSAKENAIVVYMKEFDTIDMLVEFLGKLSKSMIAHNLEEVEVYAETYLTSATRHTLFSSVDGYWRSLKYHNMIPGAGHVSPGIEPALFEYVERTRIIPFVDQGFLSLTYNPNSVKAVHRGDGTLGYRAYSDGYFRDAYYITDVLMSRNPNYAIRWNQPYVKPVFRQQYVPTGKKSKWITVPPLKSQKPPTPKPIPAPQFHQILAQGTVTKKMIYDALSKEFLHPSTETYPSSSSNRVLDLKIVENVNSVSIISHNEKGNVADTFGLRLFIQTHIQNRDKNGRALRPKFFKNVGWTYFKNEHNFATLARLQRAIDNTNYLFKDHTIVPEEAPLQTGVKNGIIGWDFPFEVPEWVNKIVGNGWDPKFNPAIHETVFTFSKQAIKLDATERAIDFLRKKTKDGEKVWIGLNNDYIYGSHKKFYDPSKLIAFLRDDRSVSTIISWSKHARFGFKDSNLKTFTVFDPWKTTARGKRFKHIVDLAKKEGYTMTFQRRGFKDQGSEGSCVVVSLMRAILIAEYGIDGATMKVPYEYAILTQRLISKFR